MLKAHKNWKKCWTCKAILLKASNTAENVKIGKQYRWKQIKTEKNVEPVKQNCSKQIKQLKNVEPVK